MNVGVIEYSPTDASLAEMKTRLAVAKFDCKTPMGYEAARKGIAECRTLRVAVEKKRVELKADALAWGKKVDAEARRITSELESIEEPLQAAKDAIDNEKKRIAQEAEAKRLAELKAEEDRKAAEAEAERQALIAEENRKLAEQREALRIEQEKMAAERAENERLAAEVRAEHEKKMREEQAKLDAARKAQEAAAHEAWLKQEAAIKEAFAIQEQARLKQEAIDRAERDRLESERRKLQAERDAIDRERLAKETAERVERETKERLERERDAAEIEAKKEEEFQIAEAARLEALRPDKEKFFGWLADIEAAAHADRDYSSEEIQAAAVSALKDIRAALAKARRSV